MKKILFAIFATLTLGFNGFSQTNLAIDGTKASASSGTPTLAFDQDYNTGWTTATEVENIQYNFVSPVVIDGYAFHYNKTATVNDLPKTWTFEGSNDAVGWTVLSTVTNNPVDTAWLSFGSSNTTAYQYYRLNITGTLSGIISIGEIKMYALVAPVVTSSNVTYVETTLAACAGTVTSNGGGKLTNRGIVYNTSGSPLYGVDANRSSAGDVGSFSIDVNNLLPGTTYYMRAYAINNKFTSYGAIKSFTTLKLDQTITFGSISNEVYGVADFNPGATASSGLAVSYTSSNTAVAIIIAGNIHIVGIGNTTITASQAGNGTYYAATSVLQNLTVTKADLDITAVDKSKAYGASNPALTISYSGFVNGQNSSVLDAIPTVTTVATDASNVGGYTITLTGGSDDNYNLVLHNGTLTVNKAPLSVVAVGQTKKYGEINPVLELMYNGFVLGENESVLNTVPSASTLAGFTSPVGDYDITVSGGSDNNYQYTYVDGILSVSKADLTVTADDQAKYYGEQVPDLNMQFSGFANNEDKTVIDALPSITCAADSNSEAGSYAIEIIGGMDNNYEIVSAAGSLTVNKVILQAKVDAVTRAYGTANPVFEIQYTGFVNAENESEIDTLPIVISSATVSSNVGKYLIELTDGKDNNYDFEYAGDTLTVTKATLEAIANNVTRKYGADQVLSLSYEGFVNSDDANDLNTKPVASTTATSASTPDTYAINVSGGQDNNYDFTYTAGTLTVEKAILTATAANASRKIGTDNPVFVINYSGFVLGETTADLTDLPLATCSANAASPEGQYPILLGDGSALNYDFEYVSGILTVTPSTSILDPQTANISVYPNPANDVITINSPDNNNIQITLISASGQIMLNTEVTNGTLLDISSLQAGVYVMHIRTSENSIVQLKLVKN